MILVAHTYVLNELQQSHIPQSQMQTQIKDTKKWEKTDHAKQTDVVIPLYNLIEYSNNYSKISGSLWQYYRHESALNNNNGNINDLHDNNDSASFKFEQKMRGQTGNDGTKDI